MSSEEVVHKSLPAWLPSIDPDALGEAGLTLLIGLAVAWLVARGATRVIRNVMPPERVELARRVLFYGILGLAVVSAMRVLGFDTSLFVGAAGVLTVAIGFASQTSASNVISGLFLIGERPFSTGDWVRIGTTTGEVVGIDLLSVKLRTPANLFVRVPNETVMKAEITNLTRYPIRRLDILVQVAYAEDLARVREVIVALCDREPRILDEPRPAVRFQGFGASGIDLLIAAWAARENYIEVRDDFAFLLKAELDAQGIEIPFPHVTLYAGKHTGPVPVALQGGGDEDEVRGR